MIHRFLAMIHTFLAMIHQFLTKVPVPAEQRLGGVHSKCTLTTYIKPQKHRSVLCKLVVTVSLL